VLDRSHGSLFRARTRITRARYARVGGRSTSSAGASYARITRARYARVRGSRDLFRAFLFRAHHAHAPRTRHASPLAVMLHMQLASAPAASTTTPAHASRPRRVTHHAREKG
jgi:hypothetical protein